MLFYRGAKKSYSSGINFISGGLKKSAKDEAAEATASHEKREPEGDDVDPLLQSQFGRPRQRKQRKGYRSADGGNSAQKGSVADSCY